MDNMTIMTMSDNHGKLEGIKVPPCDLLIHAGDVCPDYAPGSPWGSGMQEGWLSSKWLNWLDLQPVVYTLATFGNHDFVRTNGTPRMFNVDELVQLGDLKIWMSPWSNTFGGWAWMKDPSDLANIYSLIPEGTDIIVSHQPPFGYGDQVPERFRFANEDPDGHVGSKELVETMNRVKPKVVICGHIHSGWGVYKHICPDGHIVKVYNVALVDEEYELVNKPTEITL